MGPSAASRFSGLRFRIPDSVLGNIGEQLGGAVADDDSAGINAAAASREVAHEEASCVVEERR